MAASSSNVVDSNPRPATPARLSMTPPGALALSCRDPHLAATPAHGLLLRTPAAAAAATGSRKRAGGRSAIRLPRVLGTRASAPGARQVGLPARCASARAPGRHMHGFSLRCQAGSFGLASPCPHRRLQPLGRCPSVNSSVLASLRVAFFSRAGRPHQAHPPGITCMAAVLLYQKTWAGWCTKSTHAPSFRGKGRRRRRRRPRPRRSSGRRTATATTPPPSLSRGVFSPVSR